jgi:hypothetical protein
MFIVVEFFKKKLKCWNGSCSKVLVKKKKMLGDLWKGRKGEGKKGGGQELFS